MERIKRLPGNFLKCGIAGWCLEVMFTSVESILNQDWRLMGRTSLLMFPIYGCGAFLGPLGNLACMMLLRWSTPSTTWVWSMTSANSFAVCR